MEAVPQPREPCPSQPRQGTFHVGEIRGSRARLQAWRVTRAALASTESRWTFLGKGLSRRRIPGLQRHPVGCREWSEEERRPPEVNESIGWRLA